MSRYRKPTPDAVATKQGWVDPRTGELLVSIRNLPNAIEGHIPNNKSTIHILKLDTAKTPPTEIEIIKAPPKKKGGWPKGKPRGKRTTTKQKE